MVSELLCTLWSQSLHSHTVFQGYLVFQWNDITYVCEYVQCAIRVFYIDNVRQYI